MTEKTKAQIKEKFAQFEYPVQIVGRHVEVTEPMKSYAIEKLSKIERFGGHIISAMIIMDIQKRIHVVEFIIHVNHTKIKVSGITDNMYASIDQAIDRLNSKMGRYMSRLHEHHGKGVSPVEMNVNVVSGDDLINDQIEEENLQRADKRRPHQIVSREGRELKVLNQQEALMKMELSEDLFMIYRSEEDRKLKVIYRRNDGNYGIIEPEK